MSQIFSDSPCTNYDRTQEGLPKVDPNTMRPFSQSPIQSEKEFMAYLAKEKERYGQNVPEGMFHISQRSDYVHAIYEAAQQYNIDPITLTAFIQKESGLLSKPTTDSSESLQWATGCGATDSGNLPQYAGFENQIKCTAATLNHWMNHYDQNYSNTGTTLDIDGQTYHIDDKYTYALAKYTPHMASLESWNDIYYSRAKALNMLNGSSSSDPCQALLNPNNFNPNEEEVNNTIENNMSQRRQENERDQRIKESEAQRARKSTRERSSFKKEEC